MFQFTSFAECPKPTGVKQVTVFDVPFVVAGITTTSTGNLAMVEFGGARAAIFSMDMTLIKELDLKGVGWLFDITRYADTLFIVDYPFKAIHVVNENGTFIKRIDTGLSWMTRLVVRGSNMWVSTENDGVHKLTFDKDYNIIDSVVLVPNSKEFNRSMGIAVFPSYIVVDCASSSNIHYLYHNGTHMLPPVRYEGPGGMDLETDSCGNAFILNWMYSRLNYYYKGDTNTSVIMGLADGMSGIPFGMTKHKDVFYVSNLPTSYFPKRIIRIEFDLSF